MRLTDLVQIDSRFEKSVNLLLDLNYHGEQKLDAYIPTHSSVNLLKRFLEEIKTYSGQRATILYGPYGKGKSHLLLVLMKLLCGEKSKELTGLIKRIAALDDEAKTLIDEITASHKFLPVIIDANSGNLNAAFIKSLNQALRVYGLNDISPDTFFSEALQSIDLWRKKYNDTYKNFCSLLKQDINDFIQQLDSHNEKALATFKQIYPSVTSGSTFNPTIEDNAIMIYQSINRTLQQYKYSGIYIIFDEFSKYIEGHTEEGFASDMKVLQDFCDLCNESRSPEPEILLTCVVHKTIRSYGSALPKSILNTFKAIEERIKEIQFVVSYQNNYELISDAITKKKSFDDWAKKSKEFQAVTQASYQIPEFSSLFEKKDFDKIVGKGCFPLTPLASCLLINLSEKIAQNERTLFTFLSGKDLLGLSSFVDKCKDVRYVGADRIYDYFLPLFVSERSTLVSHEWGKAEYCLGQTKDETEQSIIKSLAVIKMANRPDDLPASKELLLRALEIPSDKFETALQSLCDKNLIVYKEKYGCYDLMIRIGVDAETEISDCITKYYSSVSLSDVLNHAKQRRYILPKKYNQTYAMTRYFKVSYMDSDSFLKFASSEYLSDENKPDGYLVIVFNDGTAKLDKAAFADHIKKVDDPRSAFALPKTKGIENLRKAGQRLFAVQRLMNQESFVAENAALIPVLKVLETELIEDINQWMSQTESGIKTLYFRDKSFTVAAKGLNRAVSDICDIIYDKTPVFNHEMVNRHVVSGQIAKARNTVMEDILRGRTMTAYDTGTSAEATIYRALITHTENDKNLPEIKKIIVNFIHSACDKKKPFEPLIKKLLAPPYGLRRGVLPVLILNRLADLEDMPVVYYQDQEFSIDVSLVSNIVLNPSGYSLYIEKNTAQKIQYIDGLSKLFGDYESYCKEIEERNRIAKCSCFIQAWLRSLPQASMTFQKKDHAKQDMEKLDAFRKLFIGTINPREVLFDKLPELFGKKEFSETLAEIGKLKKELDGHLSLLKQSAVCVIRKQLKIKKNANLLLSIQEWCSNLPDQAKNAILSLNSHRLLECLRTLETSDYEQIAKILSKEITGLYIEDWNDNTINEFEQGFVNLLEDIHKRQNVSSANPQKISFTTKNGVKEWQYDFDEEGSLSGPAEFFKNQIEDVLNEYETSVESNEKIGILAKIVKNIIEGKA